MSKKQKKYGDGTAFFQKEFSNSECLRFARIFGCDGEERFRCAILFTRLVPTGFLVTDKAVHFEDGTKIDFVGGSFKNENVKISSETFFNATLGVLKIEADGFFKEYYFKNTNVLALDALVAFLKGAFSGSTVENYDFSMTFKTFNGNAFFDVCGIAIEKIVNAKNAVTTKYNEITEKISKKLNENEQRREQKHQEKIAEKARKKSEKQKAKESKNTEKTQSTETSQPQQDATSDFKPIKVIKRKGPNIFVQSLDFFASMTFITGLIFAVKPEILIEVFGDVKVVGLSAGIYDMIIAAGNMTFGVFSGQLAFINVDCKDFIFWRNFLVFSCILLFFILKLIVTFTSGSSTKLVAFLMLILTILASFIVKEKVILFIAFVVILYFAFEILCGIKPRIVLQKFWALLIVGFIGYLVLNFTMSTATRVSFGSFLNTLSVRGLQWW